MASSLHGLLSELARYGCVQVASAGGSTGSLDALTVVQLDGHVLIKVNPGGSVVRDPVARERYYREIEERFAPLKKLDTQVRIVVGSTALIPGVRLLRELVVDGRACYRGEHRMTMAMWMTLWMALSLGVGLLARWGVPKVTGWVVGKVIQRVIGRLGKGG